MAAATTSGDSRTDAVPPAPLTADAGVDRAAQVQQLRRNGNTAFGKKKMVDAKKFYSEALEVATTHGINDSAHECHKIYSNR